MTVGRRVAVVVVILLGVAVSGGVARAHAGLAYVACGMRQRITQQSSASAWVYSRPNPFNDRGQRLCIAGSTTNPGFTILDNLRYTGAWQAYPFTGAGCAFNLCSRRTDLPKKVRTLPAE